MGGPAVFGRAVRSKVGKECCFLRLTNVIHAVEAEARGLDNGSFQSLFVWTWTGLARQVRLIDMTLKKDLASSRRE